MAIETGTPPDGDYRVTAPYFVALVVVRNGKVTDESAPILRWARSKTAAEVWRWFRNRGFTWMRLNV